MGAKFTRLQPAQIAWMEDGIVKVKNMYSEIITVKTTLSMSFKPDKSNFLYQNVFVCLKENNLMFVLRRDGTWSLYEDTGKLLLLDFGFVEDLPKELFDIEYMPIGFMRAQKIVFPIVLDLSSRRVAHGTLEDGMSNGYDIYFGKEVKYNKNDTVENQFDRDRALYSALNPKVEETSIYIYDIDGSRLNIDFRIINRVNS